MVKGVHIGKIKDCESFFFLRSILTRATLSLINTRKGVVSKTMLFKTLLSLSCFQKAPFSWAFLDPFCLDVRQKRIKRMCFETKSPRCRWDPQLFRCDFEWSQYCVFIWKQTILMHFLQPSTKENWENVKLINRLLKKPTTRSRGDWNKF